ncbi:histidine phosphatase family protein [Candidatus Pacearchaeota archaeon]|nr:histidine phosphatase family protein [Candidatus Pacearchaeota archaeon]
MTLKNPKNYEKGKTLVFLVRHGDRIHISGNPNLGLKIPGPGLSALGKKQAKSVAKKFAKVKLPKARP